MVANTALLCLSYFFPRLMARCPCPPVDFFFVSVASCVVSQQSRDGVFFGLINLVGNFSTVFIDQSYWQSAIAATPSASWKGFLLGGLCWFAIPYVFRPIFVFVCVSPRV